MIDFFKPVDAAWYRMERMLFKPFDIGRWFVLGFSAWLAALGEGSFPGLGNGNVFQQQGKNPELQKAFHEMGTGMVSQGLHFWLVGMFFVWLLVLVVMLLLNWVGCRGQFMFLDNVLHNRAEVSKPWHEFKKQGDSLFLLCSVIGICIVTLTFAFAAVVLVFAWPDVGSGKVRSFSTYLPFIAGGLLLLLAWLVVIIYLFFLREFGVPMMYRDKIGAQETSSRIWKLGSSRPLDFLAYLFMRIVIAVLFLIMTFLVGCLTCCLGFLPYLSTVFTLPIRTFRVGYTLGCLSQMTGETYWPPDDTSPPPMPAPFPS